MDSDESAGSPQASRYPAVLTDWLPLEWRGAERLLGVVVAPPAALEGRWTMTEVISSINEKAGTAEAVTGNQYLLRQPMQIWPSDTRTVIRNFAFIDAWLVGDLIEAARLRPDVPLTGVPDEVWSGAVEAARALDIEWPVRTSDSVREFLRQHCPLIVSDRERRRHELRHRDVVIATEP